MMKALFHREKLLIVQSFLENNNIQYEEWISSNGDKEIRVDLENITEEEINKLYEFDDYGDVLDYHTYLIFWE